jgi:alpha-1,2-mannosyltransferase
LPPVRAAFRKLPARAALITANVVTVTLFLLSYSRHGVGFGAYHIDLDVYRIGGRAWLRGVDLYGRLPATRAGVRLPFTYPPIAAFLLSPFALVPMTVATTVLSLATITLLAVVLRLFLRHVAGTAAGSPWALAWLLLPALFLEPVRDTLGFGQVNVVLMALVSLDCLTETPSWPRGALTGLAAAVKLTPAAFVLFFLVRRDFRAACTTAVTFAAVTVLGFAVDWHDSVRYWTSIVFEVGRPGGLQSASNQSILAVLVRAGLDPHMLAGTAIWLALSGAVAALACRGMRLALAASEDCLALCLNAFAALLISPISWSHHWVWCAPALLTFVALGVSRHSRPLLAAACIGISTFTTAPQFWFSRGHNAELSWAAWQMIINSPYVFFAALTLLLASSASTFSVVRRNRVRPLIHVNGGQMARRDSELVQVGDVVEHQMTYRPPREPLASHSANRAIAPEVGCLSRGPDCYHCRRRTASLGCLGTSWGPHVPRATARRQRTPRRARCITCMTCMTCMSA